MMGMNPAPAAPPQNALSDFGGMADSKRAPDPTSAPSGASFESSFSETSKLRAQLRAAEEMERRAKKATTELRTQNDEMQRNMQNMQEQMNAMQEHNKQCMMESAQAK